MGIHLDWRYSLLTAALLAAIYWMSAVPDLSSTESDPLVLLAQNLAHAPVFAVLTFCCLKALSGGLEISGPASGFAGLASGGFAVLDEWHQSWVPGRHASVGDLLLDVAGIGAMLVIVRLTRLRRGAGIRAGLLRP
jgi:VanZ family protein